jgi:pimeloyl-ACP methyl ester carboxylesterase
MVARQIGRPAGRRVPRAAEAFRRDPPQYRRGLWSRFRVKKPTALILSFALTVGVAAAAPEKKLPLPGEVFLVKGRTAFVIPPAKPAVGSPGSAIPWVWYAPTLPNLPGDAEKWMFERFTAAGIAIVGIDVGESHGNRDGQALYSALYEELTTRRGFARKAVLLGRSRGGLMTLAWAAANPGKVAGFAGIYPVCNLASYPGLARASGDYGLTPEELTARLAEHNPVDRLAPLAKAGVPLFAIHGDRDATVPLDLNSGLMRTRYEALGGKMELVVPAGQGHNMWPGFFQCEALVEFVLARADRTKPPAPGR